MTRAVASVRDVDDSLGIHLTRVAADPAQLDAVADKHGGRVGLAGVLGHLTYRARASRTARVLGRDVHRAYTWDRADTGDQAWWPQGISSSADATAEGTVEGRRLLVVAWYSPAGHGCRVTFVDLDSLRYQHVTVVRPDLSPVQVHAGGVVWCGRRLHLAATAKGFVTCDLDDIVRTDQGHFLLPVRYDHRAAADKGHDRLRYSFLSLDRWSTPPALVAGEYGRPGDTTRFARFEMDLATGLPVTGADNRAWPVHLDDRGLVQMQGAVVARETYVVTVSHGRWAPGSLYVGRPGHFRERRLAVPMGPEDLTYSAQDDLIWSLTEHPGKRWFFSMRRSRLDPR